LKNQQIKGLLLLLLLSSSFFLLISNGKSAHEQIAKQKQPKKSKIAKSEMDAKLEEVSLI
jgi:hypothetical protein